MLCWWYWDHRLRAVGGKPFSGFTDRGINKVLGLHQHSQVFQTCHILGIGDEAGWVLGQGCKSVCNMKNIQHISSIFWQCYTLMKEITPRVGMEELQGLAELCSELSEVTYHMDWNFSASWCHPDESYLRWCKWEMARIITRAHCSEVGFMVPIMSVMVQVELTHVSASSCLHRDMAIPVGLLLSTWSAFVVNRWEVCFFT